MARKGHGCGGLCLTELVPSSSHGVVVWVDEVLEELVLIPDELLGIVLLILRASSLLGLAVVEALGF